MQIKDRSFIYLQSMILIVQLIAGCTFRVPQPIHRIDLPPVSDKINLHIGLIITEDYHNKEFIVKGGDTYILPIGENLVHHSKELVYKVFRDPFILKEGDEKKVGQKIKYFLKPKVLMTERTTGVFSFSESKTTIGIEWKLYKNESKPLWVESIIGTGVGQSGGVFELHGLLTKNVGLALQDLFNKSQKAMASSILLHSLKEDLSDYEIFAQSGAHTPKTDIAPSSRLKPANTVQVAGKMSHDLPDHSERVSIDEIPSGPLTSAQIKDFFSNKIAKGTHIRRGILFIRHFRSDGTVVEESPQARKHYGHWRVVQDRLCIRWRHGRERCGKIVKENGMINVYGVGKIGTGMRAATYEEFISANDQ